MIIIKFILLLKKSNQGDFNIKYILYYAQCLYTLFPLELFFIDCLIITQITQLGNKRRANSRHAFSTKKNHIIISRYYYSVPTYYYINYYFSNITKVEIKTKKV